MKKAIFLLAWVTMAASCLLLFYATEDTRLKDTKISEVVQVQENDTSITTVDESEASWPDEEISVAKQDTAEALKGKMLLDESSAYAFSCLSEEEKNIYLEILSALLQRGENVTLSTKEKDEVEKVFSCVMLDHPEIFYVTGYKYTEYSAGDEVKRLAFTGNFLYDSVETDRRMKLIEDAADSILNGINRNADDYEKVKYVYETLINQTQYDLDAPDNQNICSVFLEHRSVCQGYAKATQYLLNQLGVKTTLVIGNVKSGEGHAWNLVLVDGNYYYVDTTWGDAYYLLSSEEGVNEQASTPSINYDYLCVTTEQILGTHSLNSVVPMPVCSSLTANYYVKEGAYFESYDKDKIGELFRRARKEGRETVTLKCANEAVYRDMIEGLIDGQEVFEYMTPDEGTIAYTNCDEQRSISFWM